MPIRRSRGNTHVRVHGEGEWQRVGSVPGEECQPPFYAVVVDAAEEVGREEVVLHVLVIVDGEPCLLVVVSVHGHGRVTLGGTAGGRIEALPESRPQLVHLEHFLGDDALKASNFSICDR